MDPRPAVVIDIGSYGCRVGYSGETRPRAVTRAVVGRPRVHVCMGPLKPSYLSVEALARRDVLTLRTPVQHGIICDWDDMELLWRGAFYDTLSVESCGQTVLLTEASLTPRNHREKKTQEMFETFECAAVYIAEQAALSLLTIGRRTGVVVDVGNGQPSVVPVVEGRVLPDAILRIQHDGGAEIADCLARLLADSGVHRFTTSAEMEIVREIKEKLCYVAEDYTAEMQAATGDSSTVEATYELPDGSTIKLGTERFRCTESLFDHHDRYDLSAAIKQSIKCCDAGLHTELYANVVLSGGTSLLPGFAQRLRINLTSNSSSPSDVAVDVVAHPDRTLLAWLGGSLLAARTTFAEMCMTKDEYDEVGPTLVHKKCVSFQMA